MHRSNLRLVFDDLVRYNFARAHSGSPAFRSPSANSVAFECPPRALHEEIVKAGSTSRRRAAAPRASSSRPPWVDAVEKVCDGGGKLPLESLLRSWLNCPSSSASDVAIDDFAKPLEPIPLEPHEVELTDWSEVGGGRVYGDAG